MESEEREEVEPVGNEEQVLKRLRQQMQNKKKSLVWEGVGSLEDSVVTIAGNTSAIYSLPPPSSPFKTGAKCGRSGRFSCKFREESETSAASLSSLIRAETTNNSLECWDYTVELECLQGHDGIPMQLLVVSGLLCPTSTKQQQHVICSGNRYRVCLCV